MPFTRRPTIDPYEPGRAEQWRTSRWEAFAISAVSLLTGLVFGYPVFAIYAFSTMVDPQIVGRERTRLIADRFLYGDGTFQIVFVTSFALVATTALMASIVFFVHGATGRPTLWTSTAVSCAAGIAVTASAIVWLIVL